MKKLIFLIILILLSSSTLGDMWDMHINDGEIVLASGVSSNFKDLIKGNEEIYFGCNAITDATVIWYFNEKDREKTYQQSHVKRSYENCNILAGSDVESQVCCMGIGIHHTQDAIGSHGIKGIKGFTSECIERYKSTNILLHPACENAMLEAVLNDMTPTERERITAKAGNAYDFVGSTIAEMKTNKFAILAAESFGFTTPAQKDSYYNAISIVGDFMKKGQGTGYVDMYKSQRELPLTWTLYPWIALGIFALLIFTGFRFGINKWKYTFIGISTLGLGLSIFVLVAIYSGQAFIWYRSFSAFTPTILFTSSLILAIMGIFMAVKMKKALRVISVSLFVILLVHSIFVLATTKFGIIEIPDYLEHRQRVQDAVETFLVTENLAVTNAHGFNFEEGGQFFEGTLLVAESKVDFLKWLPVISIIFLMFILFVQMRRKK